MEFEEEEKVWFLHSSPVEGEGLKDIHTQIKVSTLSPRNSELSVEENKRIPIRFIVSPRPQNQPSLILWRDVVVSRVSKVGSNDDKVKNSIRSDKHYEEEGLGNSQRKGNTLS
jgi:hypothetical protein